MTIALDPAFPCVSAGSGATVHYPRAQVVDELSRTLDMQRDKFPKLVAKGQMSKLEADRDIGLLAAIHADLLAVERMGQSDYAQRRETADRRLAAFAWADLVACLRAEILWRRGYYPRLVEKGTVKPPVAARQLERIEAAHLLYWRLGQSFWPAELGAWRPTVASDEEARIYRAALFQHHSRFDLSMTALRGEYAAPAAARQPDLLCAAE